MKRVICTFLMGILMANASVVGAMGVKPPVIRMEGSTTVLPIAQWAAEEFMKKHPKVDISVRGGGSGVGIAALIDGVCDIANASRPIKDKEIEAATSKGVTPVAHIVAKDGIVVIVHPSNSIGGLTKEQIKAIYTGEISNWSKLGGPDKEIVVVSRDSGSGTFGTFRKLALDKEKTRRDALIQASNKAVATIVATTPGAIGYVGVGYISPKVKAISVDGVECKKETVFSGEYPLARSLFMYTNGEPTGAVKELLDFIKSDKGQKLVEKVGYIGLK
ncbi:PstS family phosphate ABC transporter substrate-binding protein [bacterium]|nr:PstS family phosphate ABC transporter substrate-binding protein [bacterium]